MDDLVLTRAVDEASLPVVVTVKQDDGAYTEGPHCAIEAGNAIELTADELAWVVEDAGPQALAALRAVPAEAE